MRHITRKIKFILISICLCFLSYIGIQYKFSAKTSFEEYDSTNKRFPINKIVSQNELRNSFLNNNEQSKILTTTKEENKNTFFKAFDGGGFGAVNLGTIKCSNDVSIEIVNKNLGESNFSYFHMSAPPPNSNISKKDKPHYIMVYTMESEVI
jgi:hypothetical protein